MLDLEPDEQVPESETKVSGSKFLATLNSPANMFEFEEFMDIQYESANVKNPNRLNATQWKQIGKALRLSKKQKTNRTTVLDAVFKKYVNAKQTDAFLDTARKGLLNQSQFKMALEYIQNLM
jgi:hypothetical protein